MYPLRVAEQCDAIAIEAMVRRSALSAYKDIFPPDAPMPSTAEALADWRELLRADGNSQRVRVIAAIDSEAVIGVVAVGVDATYDACAHISRLYVDPPLWGRGIGTSLYRAATRQLLAAGYGQATLWTLEKNARARCWYERLGWRATGERVPVYTPGDVYDLVYFLNFAGQPSSTR